MTIGTYRGEPFAIEGAMRLQHCFIVGATGSGKSNLQANMIGQDLEAGNGVCVIDPHGDLANQVLTLVPTWRTSDLVYINLPDRQRPIGFNVIDVPPERHQKATEDIVAAFIHVFGADAIQGRSQQILRNSLRALMCVPNMSLLALPRLLNDRYFREQRIVPRITDPVVKAYWTQQFSEYSDRVRSEYCTPILNKLDPILIGHLRPIVAQPRSTIDLRYLMDNNRIILVNLEKGTVGKATADLFAATFVDALVAAGLSRADIDPKERQPFYLYFDEFGPYSTQAVQIILSEARKYGLGLTLATQYLDTMSEELQTAVLANVATLISLRIGPEDADRIVKHLRLGEPHHNPKLLTGLEHFNAYAHTIIDNAVTDPIFLQLNPPPKPVNHRPHRLIKHSRIHYGTERKKVDTRIRKFLES